MTALKGVVPPSASKGFCPPVKGQEGVPRDMVTRRARIEKKEKVGDGNLATLGPSLVRYVGVSLVH